MTNPTPEQRAANLWQAILGGLTGNEFVILAETEIYAVIRAAELAQAERDARLCERQSRSGPLYQAARLFADAIRNAANEPSRNPVP